MAIEADVSEGVPDFASEFAEFAANLTVAQLPGNVIAAVIANIFDTLACSSAGRTAAGVGEMDGLIRGWGGTPEASIWWSGAKVPAHHAALVNGMMSHARDFDDTHDGAILHAGVSVIPAAFAAAEANPDATGEDMVCAVAAGLELICRLGVATRIGLIESGFMYTSLFGHFAAAVAAARAMRLDAAATANAIGVVYSQAAGTHQVTRDAALTKRMQPGFAAKAGVLSARISALGINGARAPFEGKDGLFRSYLRDNYDPSVLREGLGSRYELINLSYKPYPCCRFNHTGIEAALNLRDRLATDTARIERIRVGVNRQAFEAVCTPLEMRSAPRTTVEAQFSLPYTVACAIVKGRVSIADFAPEVLQTPAVVALAGKVEAYIDPEIERKWARGVPPARLEVTIAGQSWMEVVEGASGSPDKPFTDRQFADKWRDCLAVGSVDRSEAFVEDLRGLLRALPGVGGLGELFWLVGGDGAVA